MLNMSSSAHHLPGARRLLGVSVSACVAKARTLGSGSVGGARLDALSSPIAPMRLFAGPTADWISSARTRSWTLDTDQEPAPGRRLGVASAAFWDWWPGVTLVLRATRPCCNAPVAVDSARRRPPGPRLSTGRVGLGYLPGRSRKSRPKPSRFRRRRPGSSHHRRCMSRSARLSRTPNPVPLRHSCRSGKS